MPKANMNNFTTFLGSVDKLVLVLFLSPVLLVILVRIAELILLVFALIYEFAD